MLPSPKRKCGKQFNLCLQTKLLAPMDSQGSFTRLVGRLLNLRSWRQYQLYGVGSCAISSCLTLLTLLSSQKRKMLQASEISDQSVWSILSQSSSQNSLQIGLLVDWTNWFDQIRVLLLKVGLFLTISC